MPAQNNHLALARKYRPQNFEQLLGQSHVLKALINALDVNRMHHAYLFTGTRGVGKTSLARIITKAVNCEKGVSSKPCLVCNHCKEIAQGSFIDLIEIDAASRTGVDDTRDLLEKVQYLPVQGRYKVYLIDEVHMFSRASFNALLKTLEEPPAHVIFLLATTNAEKIPLTVLSRCLQFSLKRILPETIFSQLEEILVKEKVQYDEKSLQTIAKAADGSMRDGLSLLDQAIAYGQGKIVAGVVEKMLGFISDDMTEDLLTALAKNDGNQLLKLSENIYQMGLDYQNIFNELLDVVHQIAIVHTVANTEFIEPLKREQVEKLSELITEEQCQLFYEIGRKCIESLNNAHNPKLNFDMALFRMARFTPDSMRVVYQNENQNQDLQNDLKKKP